MAKKVKIEKLVFGGQGLAHIDGQAIFVWNALPGETVEVEMITKKKQIFEGYAKKILQSSPSRVSPKEDHFLSCSPWQIMSFDAENSWKKKISREVFEKIGKFKIDKLEIESDSNQQFGYRNKIEYSFTEGENGEVSLAFFNRGSKKRLMIENCQLSGLAINRTAKIILAWINERKISIRSLKSLVLRSNEKGESIAALFIKDKINFEDYPKIKGKFKGFCLYYSTHKCPASVPTELLYAEGQDSLVENINGVDLCYGLLSFFQINVPLFEKALRDIADFLDKKIAIVDFYSGVGSICLPLHKNFRDAILVESNEEAVNYANQNIEDNKISNCQIAFSPAEKVSDLIESEKIIIFDPPRAGLHQKIVDRVLKVKPKKIIYLSCNLSTQARDLQLFSSAYKLSFLKLYNFFPRTPHVEALAVLEKK